MSGTRPPKRAMRTLALVTGAGALIALSAPAPAVGQVTSVSSGKVHVEIADKADDVRPFYATRGFRPLWLGGDGRARPAVHGLLERLDSAEFDAIDGKALRKLRTKSVRRLLRRAADGEAHDIARAEVELSNLFADYVRATRSAPRAEMILESKALAPAVPTTMYALKSAGEAQSLERYIQHMGWMHPLYAPLRDAMGVRSFTAAQRSAVWETLGRVRVLPSTGEGRYVLVDAAGSTLWMYEDGKPVDSMRVVVGKPGNQTPMMAGFLRHAIVNPYWNVPPDLVQRNIAANVLEVGTGYLKKGGYEVLSDFSENPALLDPKSVDWSAVAAGTRTLRVRQKPGGSNFMGKVKYEFPNAQGIYLHDTPDRHLLSEDQRQLSSGCVRLEDADMLGRWLLGKRLPKPGKKPEQRVELPKLVPIYITYLTAMPTQAGIAFRSDIYGLDRAPQLASLGD